MNSIEKGINELTEKINSGKDLEHKDFVIALTAALLEEVSLDLKSGTQNESSHNE